MRRFLIPAALVAVLFPAAASAQRPVLGVTVSPVAAEVLEFLGIEGGLKIDTVTEERGAARAGLQANDLLIQVGAQAIASLDMLREELGKHKPGDKVGVVVLRRGDRKKFEVELSAADEPGGVVSLEDVTESMTPLPPEPPVAPKAKPKTAYTYTQDAELARRLAERLAEMREQIAQRAEGIEQLAEQQQEELRAKLEAVAKAHADSEHAKELKGAIDRIVRDATRGQGNVKREIDSAVRDMTRAIERQARELAQQAQRVAAGRFLYDLGAVETARDPLAIVPTPAPTFVGQHRLEEVNDRLAKIEERLDRIEVLLRERRDR